MSRILDHVCVPIGDRSYEIRIGNGLLGDAETYSALPTAPTAVIVSNNVVAPLCAAMLNNGAPNCDLQYIALQEGFFMAFNISLAAGFVLAFPIIAYQLWRFVAPGLYRTEKNAFLPPTAKACF